MTRRRTREPGRPTLLTPDVESKLIEATRTGSPMQISAVYAGISLKSFEKWMARGYAEEQAVSDGEPADPDEARYHQLYVKVMEARATAAVQSVVAIRKAAIGGAITEETTKRYRDPDTGTTVEEKTVKRSAPDWRAAAFHLERLERGYFGRSNEVNVEVSGAGGGPVQVEVDTTALAEQVRANIAAAAMAALPAAPTEEIVDAVEVTDDQQEHAGGS